VNDPLATDERPVLLALRALKLGDLLVAVPALTALRRGHPDHRFVLAAPAWLEPVVRLVEPAIELLPTAGLDDPIAWHGAVDCAVNLHGRGPESTALLEALRPARRLGHAALGWAGPEWRDGMLERARWARLVTWHGFPASADDVGLMVPDAPPAVPHAAIVHVGAFYGARRWPAERFAAVARALAAAGLEVVVMAGPAEGPRADEVARLAGIRSQHVFAGDRALPLDRLAALVADAAVLVSVDTGVAHLASAYRVPSVVIFGPAPASEWGPPPGPHVVLTDESARRGDVFSDVPDPALLAVSARAAADAALSLLRRRPPALPGRSGRARGATGPGSSRAAATPASG
jgi:hypothetical protein